MQNYAPSDPGKLLIYYNIILHIQTCKFGIHFVLLILYQICTQIEWNRHRSKALKEIYRSVPNSSNLKTCTVSWGPNKTKYWSTKIDLFTKDSFEKKCNVSQGHWYIILDVAFIFGLFTFWTFDPSKISSPSLFFLDFLPKISSSSL